MDKTKHSGLGSKIPITVLAMTLGDAHHKATLHVTVGSGAEIVASDAAFGCLGLAR